MESLKFKTVDEYLGAAPLESIERLKLIRKEIKKMAPQAEEIISYNMPALKYKKVLVYYAGYKSHIGFYPTPYIITQFSQELSEYKTAKGSVQFPHNQALPLDLILKMTKSRYQDNLPV